MSGLYQRALEYLHSQRHLRLVRPDEEEFQGTAEEKAQIEGEIREAVNENRIHVGPETFRLRPRHSGAGLPILVNLIALALIAGGVYGLLQLFTNQEQELVTRTSSVASAEGRLLSALREESQEQLAAKEAEIDSIERRLAEAQAEREQIRAQASSRLQQQETQLRAEFQAALEAERERLLGMDLTAQERERQLAAFRAREESELEEELAQLEAAAGEEIRAQEEAIEEIVREFERSLATARREQVQLQDELDAREAELQAQFDRREAQLSSERAAAQELLRELEGQQEQRQLVLDQILSFYTGVREALNERDYESARTSLASLREYLRAGPITAVPELQRRRGVELFLVDTLDEQIRRAQNEASADTQSLVASAGLISEVGELVSTAEGAYESGELAQARELYVAALSRIPAVRLGYERLAQIEESLEAGATEQVAALIEEGNEFYRAGSYQAAVERYGQAMASLPQPDDQLLERVLDAGYELRAGDSLAQLANLRDELATARETLARRQQTIAQQASALEARDQTIEAREDELADLRSRLRTVDELLASEEQRTQTLRGRLAESRAEVTALNEDLRTTESLVTTLRGQLAQADARTSANARADERAAARLEQELASTREELAATSEELTATREELDVAREELAAGEARLTALDDEVELLRDRLQDQQAIVSRIEAYENAFGGVPASGDESRVDPLELLETKLLILRIVGSEAVRADYPDLYDELNAYLDALVAEQRADAARDTLRELSSLLTELSRRTQARIADALELARDYPILARAVGAGATTDVLTRLRSISTP